MDTVKFLWVVPFLPLAGAFLNLILGKRLSRQVVGFVQELRKLDLFKSPGVAESIDWATALSELNKLRGMSPRAAITKHLLDGDDSVLSSFEKSFDDAKSAVAETRAELVVPPAAAQRSPAVPAEPDPTLPTPFDPDAT